MRPPVEIMGWWIKAAKKTCEERCCFGNFLLFATFAKCFDIFAFGLNPELLFQSINVIFSTHHLRLVNQFSSHCVQRDQVALQYE
jgi:hypothetical protein